MELKELDVCPLEREVLDVLGKNLAWIVSNKKLKMIPVRFSPKEIATSFAHKANGAFIFDVNHVPKPTEEALALLIPKCSHIYCNLSKEDFARLLVSTALRHHTDEFISSFLRSMGISHSLKRMNMHPLKIETVSLSLYNTVN